MRSCLLIFAKQPEPGRCKTRLIPALGADGAAALHATLVRHTLSWVARLPNSVTVDLLYAGDSPGWFRKQCDDRAPSVALYPQADGDLGARLQAGFARAFANGMQRVVAVGTDCPDLTEELVGAAFTQLQVNDVVIGPAADGGYYLIGTAAPAAELFHGIDWGESSVFSQTMQIIEAKKMSVSTLPTLNDVDRPDDLDLCRRLGLLDCPKPYA